MRGVEGEGWVMVFFAHFNMGDGMRGQEQKSHHSRL